MNVAFSRREPGGIEFGIIYGAIVLLALVIARFPPVLSLIPDCTFRVLTGFPCPTCGSTRSLVHLSHARFLPAFVMNPLASFILIGMSIGFFYGIITLFLKLPRVRISLSDAEKDRVRKTAFLIVLLNWLYLCFAL